MKLSPIDRNEVVFLMRNLDFKHVCVKEVRIHPSDNGEAEVLVQHSGFLKKKEIVKRRELLSVHDYRYVQDMISNIRGLKLS